MNSDRLVSIVIDNYNYAEFLKDSIDSALNQYYPNTEIIVVDDGSTDGSRSVIDSYGSRILPILKENRGQASAFNRGYAASSGDVVIFLDSDDMLLPTAVHRAAAVFDSPNVVKAHWPLALIDECGRQTNRLRPGLHLAEGDLRGELFRLGPTNHLSAPTSGNAWARHYLDKILPVPESVYTTCADTYLFELAPFFGLLRRISEPQSLYRRHSRNGYSSLTLQRKLQLELRFYDNYSAALIQHYRTVGLHVDADMWRKGSWWHRLELALEDLTTLPHTGSLILVDDATWEAGDIGKRARLSFLEYDGTYWGPPPDDDTAIRELERMRSAGAGHIAFTWVAFWWLEQYAAFRKYLYSQFSCVLQNERLVVFDLSDHQTEDHARA